MSIKKVTKKEMEDVKGGFKPDFSVSAESEAMYLTKTSACDGPYVLAACSDPVFTYHGCQ